MLTRVKKALSSEFPKSVNSSQTTTNSTSTSTSTASTFAFISQRELLPKHKHKQTLTNCLIEQCSKLQLHNDARLFTKRITCLEWVPNEPNLLCVGSKNGNICLWDTNSEKDNNGYTQNFLASHRCCVNSFTFLPSNSMKLASVAVDGVLKITDINTRASQHLIDVYEHENWLCSLDANENLAVAGDEKGHAYFKDMRDKTFTKRKLHNGKIKSLHFNPFEGNYLCTASNDHTSDVFDVRMLFNEKEEVTHKTRKSLYRFQHDSVVESAYFSPITGSKILTTSQNLVNIYDINSTTPEVPWKIDHKHQFFQYLTPFKASWHPIDENIFVIGRYIPKHKLEDYEKKNDTYIDIFNVSGHWGEEPKFVSLHSERVTYLSPINKFNPHEANVLASGSGHHVCIWKQKDQEDILFQKQKEIFKGKRVTNETSTRPKRSKSDSLLMETSSKRKKKD